MENKKSIQLSQAFGAVLTLVLVAVLVIVAIVIFVSLETSFSANTAASAENETLTVWTDLVNQTLAGSDTCGYGTTDVSSVVVYNATNSFLLLTGNYSVNADGNIANLSGTYSIYPWQITYDYTTGNSACDASQDMTTEFGNYTSLIGLVGTIIFLGLVIGVLVASFAFGGRKEV